MGSGNWIVDNLNSALGTWNGKLAEIWQLLSTTPEEFKGGGVWTVMQDINGALQAIGCALLVLFFVMGVVKTCSSFTDLYHPRNLQRAARAAEWAAVRNVPRLRGRWSAWCLPNRLFLPSEPPSSLQWSPRS